MTPAMQFKGGTVVMLVSTYSLLLFNWTPKRGH
jgi:hypothetical protein